MELFGNPEVTTSQYMGENVGLLYQPPSVNYGIVPPVQQPLLRPYPQSPYPGAQISPYLGGGLPPGVSGPAVQTPTVQVAQGYKWKESAPVVVYLALVIAGLLLIVFTPGSAKAKLIHMLVAVVWTLLWGFFVVWAAKKGKTALAWVLAITPIVIWLIIQILIFIKAVVINA